MSTEPPSTAGQTMHRRQGCNRGRVCRLVVELDPRTHLPRRGQPPDGDKELGAVAHPLARGFTRAEVVVLHTRRDCPQVIALRAPTNLPMLNTVAAVAPNRRRDSSSSKACSQPAEMAGEGSIRAVSMPAVRRRARVPRRGRGLGRRRARLQLDPVHQPQTVAYALNDSPAGLAAHVVEKWRSWSDDLDAIDRDVLLTMLTIFWVTETIGTSVRDYYDMRWHSQD